MADIEYSNIDELTIESDERKSALLIVIGIVVVIILAGTGIMSFDEGSNGNKKGKIFLFIAVFAVIFFQVIGDNQYFKIVINSKTGIVQVTRVQMFIFTHKETYNLKQIRLNKRTEKGSYDDLWYIADMHLGNQSYDFTSSLDEQTMLTDFEMVKAFLEKNKTNRP